MTRPAEQPQSHEVSIGIPMGELLRGHESPSVSTLQIDLLQKYAARDALIDRPQAATGQMNGTINGAHPFHTSVESQAHWKNVTDIVGVKRMAEKASIAKTELVTDTLTPLFENGTPGILDRIGRALNAAAKPALVTGTALAPAAVLINFDQKPTVFDQEASPSAQPSAEPSPAPSTEPSPVPSGEPIDPCAEPPIGDPGVARPTPAPSSEIVIMAAEDQGEVFDDSNMDPDQDNASFDEAAADDGTLEEPEDIDTGVVEGADAGAVGPECPEELLSATDALEAILTQKDEDIDKIKPGKIRGLVDALWLGNPELDTFVIPAHPDIPFSKEEINGYLDGLFDKKAQFRIYDAANGIAMLFAVYDWEEKQSAEGKISAELSTQARKAISNLADRIYDYSIIELTVRGNRDATKALMAEVSRSGLEFNLSYTG
ncbi:MAG: hypothetical protein HY426_04010 [Candidatus Levybacteria bacterium]|nr:hypothetical protein [Candidatus Levybacteria bacterium]